MNFGANVAKPLRRMPAKDKEKLSWFGFYLFIDLVLFRTFSNKQKLP